MEGLIRDEEDIGDDEDMGDEFSGDSRLDDRPEIGVPNVFVIQAKFLGATSTL
ncbi:5482_t:CDS:2 [Paraglomus brasilianum]|uniref:5482_t:CDS:1 n=1 Tax=Paraglomus brasilianum TaxID=144538 RepID=A0A9N9G2T5_9GLOM|nr:5482_t:CDS:2 [Paraglomus brasilianum]